jgi:hypothetical protein
MVMLVISVVCLLGFSLGFELIGLRDKVPGFVFAGSAGAAFSALWLLYRFTGRRDHPPTLALSLVGYPLVTAVGIAIAYFAFNLSSGALWTILGLQAGQLVHAVYSGLRGYRSE